MRARQPNNGQVHGMACQAKDTRPPQPRTFAPTCDRPSSRIRWTDAQLSTPGNKNKRARTTDGEPPLKSEILLKGS